MSESFAKMGTAIVEHNRYAVDTHGYLSKPDREAMMRGSAVPTIVWSRAASSTASIRPDSVPTICGFVSSIAPDVRQTVSLVARAMGRNPHYFARPLKPCATIGILKIVFALFRTP